MEKWQCLACGYVYDEEQGELEHRISPETKFEDLPDNWTCPMCGVKKEEFIKL